MKLRAFLLVAGMLIFNFAFVFSDPIPQAPSGSGTEGDPYLISNEAELFWLTQNSTEWDKHYLQTANIDLTNSNTWDVGEGFTPIGNSTNKFTGVYDGDDYEIQNLFINRNTEDLQGLFGAIEGGEIKNLGVTDANITGKARCGIISGIAITLSIISNCYTTGSIAGFENVGGIIGYLSGDVINCYSTADVTGTNSYVGGIVGKMYHNTSQIAKCYYSGGTVSTNGVDVGGIAGLIYSSEVINSYSEGTIDGYSKVGGIAGTATNGSTINKCYSKATAAASNDDIQGGVCGNVDGSSVTNCFWDTDVSGNTKGFGSGAPSPDNSEKTAAELKNIATYTSTATDGLDEAWDFTAAQNDDAGTADIWIIRPANNDGYPYFNSPPEINDQTFNVDENSANGTVVGTVTATEPDGQSLSFAITEGNTNNAFAIANDGKLTVNNQSELDYETTTSYTLTVAASDASAKGAKYQSSSAEITVNINDVDPENSAPVINDQDLGSIAENTAASTVVGGITAADAENDDLTFTIIGGNTGSAFDIVETGNLTANIVVQTESALNYETNPTFTLTVQVEDGGKGLTDDAEISIALTDVNEAPTNISLTSTSVDENQTTGTAVGTLSSTDPETGDSHTYTLVPGTGDDDNSSFDIDGTSLETAEVFDHETKDTYYIRVRSTDDGTPNEYYEKQFTITITDVNEAPTNISLTSTSVDENEVIGTAVGTLSSTDPETVDSHTYTLVSGTGDTDNGSFDISGTSLETAEVFDHETKDTYYIRVRSTDDGTPNEYFEKQFTITINDVNEAPEFESNPYNFSISETSIEDMPVGTIAANDPDDGAAITYSLSGGDAAEFDIDENTGEITVAAGASFSSGETYTFTGTADDGLSGKLTGNTTINVNINPNDVPEFDADSYSFDIDEDAATGSTVGTVSASDDDNEIIYSLSGTGSENFDIDSDGKITVSASADLDYETTTQYNLTGTAAEGAPKLSDTVPITINITNVYEAPVFEESGYVGSFDENLPTGSTVYTVKTIIDSDASSCNYSFIESGTWPDNNDFTINEDTGEIKTAKIFDYETDQGSFYGCTLKVEVDDHITKGTASTVLFLDINDINEEPVFLNTPYTETIDENTDKETVVCTLTAEDLDIAGPVKEKIEEFQNVYFDIISGNINDAFKIVLPAKGTESEHTAYVAVNKKYAVDYETVPEFNLTVKAFDDGTPTAFATETVTITLEDVDEAPVIDEPGMTNIPGIVPPGEDDGGSGGSGGGGTNPPVTIIYEDETIIYYFYGYDPEGNPLYFEWIKNGQTDGTNNKYTFVPEPLKDGEKSREYTMNFIANDETKAALNAEWKIMVLNNDNPIEVNSLTPAPNTSTDPTISTAGGSYNMTEGETLSFSVDADDPDGSLLWRNWYVNDELVWLDPDFDFNTHFMSSGGSPYDIKLYLQGQQGDYQEFHWTVYVSNKEAVTYANSPMILNGSAMIEGINAQAGDAIAAYSGNELRGEILLDNSDFSNFEINLAHDNEEISFVIYDSDNNVIKTVHKVLNGEIGTAQNILIHGYEEVSSSFALSQDWNYVSFNTIPEDNSVSSVFHNMNISQIQTVNEVYSSSNPEFLNTLKEIKPGVGYLVKMSSNSSIFVNGYSAENSEIQLHEGWNLIGYTERSSSDIETAFGSIMDKIIEIKSEVGVYSSDMPAYMNTLSTIEKNKAYWVKCSEACVLDFPRIENKENYNNLNKLNHLGTGSSDYAIGGESTLNTYSTSPTRPPVDVSFGNITVRTNSFVIYAEISNPSDNTICAYSNNELRGISQIIENNNKYYTSIVINSDIAGEEISLKINNNTIKTIESVPGETIGKDNFLQLDGSLENEIPASFKVSLFPNPFNPEINISFELPKAERINISVFDINGKLVKTLEDNMFNSGKHSITWNGTDSNNNKMASGIYFVKVKSDSYNTTEKIVMLK